MDRPPPFGTRQDHVAPPSILYVPQALHYSAVALQRGRVGLRRRRVPLRRPYARAPLRLPRLSSESHRPQSLVCRSSLQLRDRRTAVVEDLLGGLHPLRQLRDAERDGLFSRGEAVRAHIELAEPGPRLGTAVGMAPFFMNWGATALRELRVRFLDRSVLEVDVDAIGHPLQRVRVVPKT